MASNLSRFISAQSTDYSRVYAELQLGHKRSHWIWYVFPQLKGLGRSANSEYYGIADVDEALEYWRHPLLGERLRECCRLLLLHSGQSIQTILPPPDDLKLCSSMTLFSGMDETDEQLPKRVLDLFFGGEVCLLTQKRLAHQN